MSILSVWIGKLFKPAEKERLYGISGDITIHVCQIDDIPQGGRDTTGRRVGLCKPDENEIWVTYSGDYSINNEPLPDFETLGHELWHLIERKFHK